MHENLPNFLLTSTALISNQTIGTTNIFQLNEEQTAKTTTTAKKEKEKVIKTISGSHFIICLLNNGEIYGKGNNTFGQCCGYNPIITTTTNIIDYHCKINGFYKVNEMDNPILQDCKVIDIFTKFNFTFYLAIHKETNKQMLLASGRNEVGNCSFNNINNSAKIISQCCFIQFPDCNNNNCNDNNNCNYNENNKFDKQNLISNELIDEEIKMIECGIYETYMLTENVKTKEQFVYQCGLNVDGLLDFGRTNNKIKVLTKCPQMMENIKSVDKNERIKQICAGSNRVSFVTGRSLNIFVNDFYFTNL